MSAPAASSPTQSKEYSADEQENMPPSAGPEMVWAQQPTAEASLVKVKFSGHAHPPPWTTFESSAPASDMVGASTTMTAESGNRASS
jgi:hypothetical protein